MMQCPSHSKKTVVGYCCICGDFGCEDCLKKHEGAFYCVKDFKPIAEKLEREKKQKKSLERPDRQRLAVHMKDDEVHLGVCFALNLNSDGFHLDLVDKRGQPLEKTQFIAYEDLKAVYYVKSFDGKFNSKTTYREWHPEGTGVVVEFSDGEILKGHTLHTYRKKERRFYVIPDDTHSNNISVLVESSAVAQVYSPEEYKSRKNRARDEYVEARKETGHPEEELCGDYHFEQKEYNAALRYYRKMLKSDPESKRLLKKLVYTEYNIGVGHIKEHKYDEALRCMMAVLKVDPENEKAKQKVLKLREVVRRKHAHSR